MNNDDFTEQVKLGRSSYIVKYNGKECIKKTNPQPESISGLILHILLRGSVKFTNELKINMALNKKQYENFNFPKTINSDGSSYIIFDFVDGTEGINMTNDNYISFIKSLVEFQTSKLELEHKVTHKLIINILRLPFNILRRALKLYITNIINLRMILQILQVLISSSICQKKLQTCLFIHNDLLPNNLITDKNDVVYIIDFENSLYENKWILTDIVDITFDIYRMKLDFKIINKYLHELEKKGIRTSEIDITCQIRLVLIRRMLQAISSNRYSKESKEIFISFLRRILLNDKEFIRWFSNMEDSINE